MRTATRRGLIVLSLSLLCSAGLMGEMARPEGQGGIPPEVVAEYVYAIVQADRTLYTTHVVERMQELGVTVATEQSISGFTMKSVRRSQGLRLRRAVSKGTMAFGESPPPADVGVPIGDAV